MPTVTVTEVEVIMCQWFTEATMVKCDQPATILLVIRTPFDVYPLELCAGCTEDVRHDPLNEILYEVGLIPFKGEPVPVNNSIGESGI